MTRTKIFDKFVISETTKVSEIGKDFTPQLYNIWNFAKNNNETKHFGNVPVELAEAL